MREALADVQAQLGRSYPLVIDGENVETRAEIVSLNPSDMSQVGRQRGGGGAEHVDGGRGGGETTRHRIGQPWGHGGGPSFCSKRRRQCAAGGSSWPPGKSTNAAKPGAKPTPTSAKRSTSANTTPAAPIELDAVAGSRRAGRGKPLRVHAARRGGRDRAVEFSAGDSHRHDDRGAGHRQHGGHEAGRAIDRHRRQADGDLSRDRPAARRAATICRARAKSSARRWSSIPTWP